GRLKAQRGGTTNLILVTAGKTVEVNNLEIGSSSGAALYTVGAGTNIKINGTLTLSKAGSGIDASGSTITFQNGNTPIVLTAGGTGTIKTDNLTNLIFGTAGNTGGTAFTIPNSVFTSAPTLGTLTINRDNNLTFNNQAITTSTAGALTGNLSISGTGTVTFPTATTTIAGTTTVGSGSTLAVGANFTATGAVTVNGTLALNGGVLTTSSTLTMANGSTISRSAGSMSAAPTLGSLASDKVNVNITSGTVTSGNEIAGTGPGVYGLLTVSGTAAYTYNPTTNITLNTGLTIASSATTALTVSATKILQFVNAATITHSGSGGITYTVGSGGFKYGTQASDRVNLVFSNSSGTAKLSQIEGSGLISGAGLTGSLSVNSGTCQINSSVSLNNDLTIAAGATLDLSAGYSFTLAGGNWSNAGTFTTHTPGAAAYTNSAVVFTGTGQTMTNTNSGTETFYNFTYNKSSGTFSPGCNINVLNLLTVSNGTFTVSTGKTLALTGGLVNNGSLVINGTLQQNTFGSVTGSGTLTYGSGSTLNLNSPVASTTQNGTTITGTGSPQVTLDAANASIVPGMLVSGTTITAGTTVEAINGTQLILSAAASSAGTNLLTFTAANNESLWRTTSGPTNVNIMQGGLTLTSDKTVNGTLTLGGGLLTTGSNKLTIGSAGSITGASASNYVDGNLAMIYGATGSKTFPTGAGGNYRPVTINATALNVTPSTFTVSQTESAFSGTLPANTTSTLARNWTIAQAGSTSYTYDLTLTGTGFTPTVTAVILQNNAGTVSSYSTTGTYTASGITSVGSFGLGDYLLSVPTAPTIDTATAGDTQASVTFTAPSSDGGSSIIDYTVTSNPGNHTATGASSPLTVTGLTNGTAYTFTVTARNSIGSGSASSASNSVTPKGNSSISITGTTSFNYNGSAQGPSTSNVTGSTGAVTYSYVGTGGTSYSASATAPTAVGTYSVTASVAADASYNGASSSATGFTIAAVVPGVPTAATATAGNAQASVVFTAPSDNGGSAIIDYTVTSNPGSHTATGASSPIVVTGLTNGTAYTFTVTARNSAGSGSASDASNSVTPVSPSVNVVADANLSTYAPTSATDVTVSSGELTVDADATVKTMTVNPGGKLTLAAGKTLTVAGAFTLHSDATGTGTLLDNGGTITAASTNVEQYLTTGRNWYVSSPISGATTNVFTAASNTMYSYYEPTGTWTPITDNSTSMVAMKGYIATVPSNGVVTFSGSLNTGDKSISLSNNPNHEKNGFNLVGNPYPSYLDWDNVTKTNLMTTIWYRTKTAANAYTFDTYNASGGLGTSNGAKAITNLIPPMQAFWVRVNSGFSGSLAVTNAQRSHADNSSNTFKAKASTAATQPIIRLEVSNGVNSDQALVYYNASASNGLDEYDSQKMPDDTATTPQIYTLAGTDQVVINGVKDMTQLTMGFTTRISNNFIIKASQFAGFASGTQIILRDNLLNYEQDLTLADYSFYSDVTVNNETRFTLLVKAPSVATGINQNTNANVWISITNNQIVVNGATGETTVAVYNEVGQRLMFQKLTSTTKSLGTFVPGVYMVTVNNAGKSVTQKVIIKK
ncbi:MAG: fibronectin type III domain-containing protein, partial [Paludibacter sp.]